MLLKKNSKSGKVFKNYWNDFLEKSVKNFQEVKNCTTNTWNTKVRKPKSFFLTINFSEKIVSLDFGI